MILNDIYLQMTLIFEQTLVEQECIPVGCVPPTAVAATGVWARTRSHSTSPSGVGLDQIPLNFPLGCGPGSDPPQLPPWVWPGSDPPQLPPWVWAWTRSPKNYQRINWKYQKKFRFCSVWTRLRYIVSTGTQMHREIYRQDTHTHTHTHTQNTHTHTYRHTQHTHKHTHRFDWLYYLPAYVDRKKFRYS